MFAFPAMLIPAAMNAGIKCPPDADKYDMREYPHFAVFCLFQLGKPVPHNTSLWNNAEIVASIPDDHIMQVTPQELLDNGFEVGVAAP